MAEERCEGWSAEEWREEEWSGGVGKGRERAVRQPLHM